MRFQTYFGFLFISSYISIIWWIVSAMPILKCYLQYFERRLILHNQMPEPILNCIGNCKNQITTSNVDHCNPTRVKNRLTNTVAAIFVYVAMAAKKVRSTHSGGRVAGGGDTTLRRAIARDALECIEYR